MEMKGWKTWAAAVATGVLGIVTYCNGNKMGGMQQIAAAVALVGIGHKIEKAAATTAGAAAKKDEA